MYWSDDSEGDDDQFLRAALQGFKISASRLREQVINFSKMPGLQTSEAITELNDEFVGIQANLRAREAAVGRMSDQCQESLRQLLAECHQVLADLQDLFASAASPDMQGVQRPPEQNREGPNPPAMTRFKSPAITISKKAK
jgi:hypothetical protein